MVFVGVSEKPLGHSRTIAAVHVRHVPCVAIDRGHYSVALPWIPIGTNISFSGRRAQPLPEYTISSARAQTLRVDQDAGKLERAPVTFVTAIATSDAVSSAKCEI